MTVVESRGVAVAARHKLVQSRSRQASCSVSLTVSRGQRRVSAHSTDLPPARRAALVAPLREIDRIGHSLDPAVVQLKAMVTARHETVWGR